MALVSALTDKFTNGNGKNHNDSDTDLLTLADPALMKVVKREGNIVHYDKGKIQRAVGLCFGSVVERIGEITPQVVTDQVDTILRLKSLQLSEDGYPAEVGIEAIQDIVEAQLMALGQFEAAKHYILYRDERRRVREESKGISPEMKTLFKEGLQTFTGTNRLLQEVQAFDKFSRFRRDFSPKRRETWPESCQRVMDYYRGHIIKIAPGSVPAATWSILHDYLLNHQATGSMRGVQMAGPALERCQTGVFNCSFCFMDSPESMAEDLYLLMQGCLPPDTPIFTENGSKSISEVKIGERVWSYNRDTKKRELKEVLALHNVNVPRDSNVKITTRNGNFITSEKHPVLVWRNGGWNYISAGSIHLGDIVMKLAVIEEFGSDEELLDAWFAGAFLGDGTSDRTKADSLRIRMTGDNESVLEGFSNAMEKLSGLSCPYKECMAERYSIPMWQIEKTIYEGNDLSERWKALVGDLQSKKVFTWRIPSWIHKCASRDIFISFLCGLIDTDGTVVGSKVYISTSSKPAVDDLVALSSVFGMQCFVTSINPEEYVGTGFTPTMPMYRVFFSAFELVDYAHFLRHDEKAEKILECHRENFQRGRGWSKASGFRKPLVIPNELIDEELSGLGLDKDPTAYHFRRKVLESQVVTAGWYAPRGVCFDHLLQYDLVEQIDRGVDVTEEFKDITVADNSSYFCGFGSFFLSHNCGVGFSVEEEYAVDKWPRIHAKRDCAPVDYTVEDDTEAWCDAVKFGIHHWIDGADVNFDLSPIRPAGSILRTKGGRASGPRPLHDLLKFDRDLIFRRQKKRLRSIDILDMTCMLHRIGQMGGVRRASGLSLSDKDDLLMRYAKTGDFLDKYPWRNQTNNSTAYEEKPSSMDFMDEWMVLAKSGSGERGIFNRHGLNYQMPPRRKRGYTMGCNPCVTGDGWVHTGEGPKRVIDLVGLPFTAIVDGRLYNSEGFFKTGTLPVLKIKFTNGMEMRLTANHQVLRVCYQSQKKQCFDWVEAGSLEVGSKVALHNHRSIEWEGSGSVEEGWLLGSLVGDGNIQSDGQVNLDFWGESRFDMVDVAVQRVMKTVGSRVELQGHHDSLYDRSRVQSVNLCRLAHQYGIVYGHKVVTEEIERASSDFYQGFLRGWFDADGSVQGLEANSLSIRLSSSVISNLQAAQRMLSRLGIISKIYPNRRDAGMRSLPDGKGGYKEYYCEADHELCITCNNIQEFSERVGFEDPLKKDLLDEALSSYRRTPNRERFVCEVESVSQEDPEDVYDCQVDVVHAFDLNGLYVHNCGEILLRNKQFCNLSIAIVDINDTYEEVEKKVEIATIWGTIQASMTNFRYISSEWKKNCEEETLLGVDILGHMDCRLLKPGASGRDEILRRLLRKVQETNIYWAQRFGINPGAALTCGKPSGDSSVFFDKPAGFKPHHGRFYLRRLRFEETNPIAKVLKDAKIPWQYDYDKTGMCVFEFPCRPPDDTIVLGDMTAVEQLENWKTWKVNFTEHNPSMTVSVKDHEWIEAGNWVYQNWDIVGGLSFFPYDDSIYPLTPYQTITEQEYTQRAKIMPTEIDWSRILLYEDEDETTLAAQIACTGPGCDI